MGGGGGGGDVGGAADSYEIPAATGNAFVRTRWRRVRKLIGSVPFRACHCREHSGPQCPGHGSRQHQIQPRNHASLSNTQTHRRYKLRIVARIDGANARDATEVTIVSSHVPPSSPAGPPQGATPSVEHVRVVARSDGAQNARRGCPKRWQSYERCKGSDELGAHHRRRRRHRPVAGSTAEKLPSRGRCSFRQVYARAGWDLLQRCQTMTVQRSRYRVPFAKNRL